MKKLILSKAKQQLVKKLKLLLLLITISMIALLFIIYIINNYKTLKNIEPLHSDINHNQQQQNSFYIENANFQGKTNNNKIYNIIAGKAIEEDKNNILLENITGTINNDKGIISIASKKGLLRIKEKILYLENTVNINYIDYANFIGDKVKIDLNNNLITSNKPIKIKFNNNTIINAKGFKVRDGKIILSGPVETIIKGN